MMFCKTIKIQSSIHLQQELYDSSLGLWLWLSNCVGPQNNSASVLTGCCETLRMCVPWDQWNEPVFLKWNAFPPFSFAIHCTSVLSGKLGCWFTTGMFLFIPSVWVSLAVPGEDVNLYERCSQEMQLSKWNWIWGAVFIFTLSVNV